MRMSSLIRGKNRNGRVVHFIAYDLQATEIPEEVLRGLEQSIQDFLDSHPWGKTMAVAVEVE